MDLKEIFKMYNYEMVQYRRSKCSVFADEIWNAIKNSMFHDRKYWWTWFLTKLKLIHGGSYRDNPKVKESICQLMSDKGVTYTNEWTFFLSLKRTHDLNNNKVEIYVTNDNMTSWQLYLIEKIKPWKITAHLLISNKCKCYISC